MHTRKAININIKLKKIGTYILLLKANKIIALIIKNIRTLKKIVI